MKNPDKCRKCGKQIAVIEWGLYRKTVVDAKAVEVIADPEGEDFIRFDGSKVRGRAASKDEVMTVFSEFAYRPHRKTCEVRK